MSTPSAELPDHPLAHRLAIPASLFVGALVTLQSAINGRLAHGLGTGPRAGVLAAVISFGTGLALLTVMLVANRRWRGDLARLRSVVRGGGLPRWQLLGGVAGALLVASQGLTVSTIGVALFIVAVVAGQTGSALSVDQMGLGPAGPQAVSPARFVGALLTLLAVVVSTGVVGGQSPSSHVLWLTLLPLVAGAAIAVQQAVNGRVAVVSGHWVATWNNFLVGWSALVIALGLTLLLPGRIDAVPSHPVLYLGGPIGVVFIATAAVVVRLIGVLVFAVASVAGQVVTAIVVDLVLNPAQVHISTYVGAGLALLGVAITVIARRSGSNRS